MKKNNSISPPLKKVISIIIALFVYTSCSVQEYESGCKGGDLRKIGQGKHIFAKNPVVIPIHGCTGWHKNLEPFYKKIEAGYEKQNYTTFYIDTLIPANRKELSLKSTIPQQAKFIYDDIEEKLQFIINNYDTLYQGVVPCSIVGISQGTAIGMELIKILEEQFEQSVSIKLFGINSVFAGCSSVDYVIDHKYSLVGFFGRIILNGSNVLERLSRGRYKIANPGLADLSKDKCKNRILSLRRFFSKERCCLVGSETEDIKPMLLDLYMKPWLRSTIIFLLRFRLFRDYRRSLFGNKTDGVLSINDQLGRDCNELGLGIVHNKIRLELIEGDFHHLSLHDNKGYIGKVYSIYNDWVTDKNN